MTPDQRSPSPVSLLDVEDQRHPGSLTSNVKPLPRLPRGWARICHESSLFLRSIGLGIVVTSLQGLFSKGFSEPTKAAVRRNRVAALLRTLIHIIPMGVALAEIILNLKSQYIGSSFTKQNYYQFAAKAHEIALQASLSAIFLSFIRSRLTSGDGLPFGAFLGGLQFLQPSYLWSSELWSSISFQKTRLWRSLTFLISVTIFAILAATAGPSSATLLIPRQNQWSQSSRWLSINGSTQDIWPDRIDSENIPQQCASLSMAEPNDLCPSADWSVIQRLLVANQGVLTRWENESNVPLILGIPDPTDTFQKKLAIAVCPTNTRHDQTCASSPQQVFMSGLFDDLLNWYKNIPSSLTFTDAIREIQSNYWEPYVVASCVDDVINSTNYQQFLQFARISETTSDFGKDREVIPVPGLVKADSVDILGNKSEYQMRWTELPQNLFPGRPLGAIILHPGNSAINRERNVTTCTIGAGWGTSAITGDLIEGSYFFSTITNVPKSWEVTNILDGPETSWTVPDYVNISGFVYPQRRVTISETWAEFLNPTIVGAEGNTTVIHSFLSIAPISVDAQLIEAILSMLVVSGLSWNGGQLDSNLLDRKEAPCPNCTIFEIKALIVGWAYSTEGTPTKLALVVMLAYCVIALAHIFYSGISGLSSTAWDSIGEVVALAMNSSPTEHLQNTCAGIIGTKAFKTNVRVLATKGDHLELVFGEVTQKHGCMKEMEPNREYGRLASEKGSNSDEHAYLVHHEKED